MIAVTLTEFLLARIAEDEADAQDDIRNRYGVKSAPHLLHCELNTYDSGPCDCGYPSRVLIDCEAKRQIVKDAEKAERYALRYPTRWSAKAGVLYLVTQRLAAIYSDHPDYDESWRP